MKNNPPKNESNVLKSYRKLKSIDTSKMSYIRKNELKETIEDIERHYFGLLDIEGLR